MPTQPDTELEDCSCESVQVCCENECEDGFEVYLTKHSVVMVCKGCETEYEVTSQGSVDAGNAVTN